MPYKFDLRLTTQAGESVLHPAVRELIRHPGIAVTRREDPLPVPAGMDQFLAALEVDATAESLARSGVASIIATSLKDMCYTIELTLHRG